MGVPLNLAHALSSAEKWDRAVTEYREAVRLFPADYATQCNLALALYKKGDAAAAVPEFEKAIALAPNEASFHLSLGMTYESSVASPRRCASIASSSRWIPSRRMPRN